jgi:hypothetical protein
MNNILFSDRMEVKSMNEAGKKFERVNRLHCRGVMYEVDFVVDVNCELFECKAGETLEVALSSSLTGAADDRTSVYCAKASPGSIAVLPLSVFIPIYTINFIQTSTTSYRLPKISTKCPCSRVLYSDAASIGKTSCP